MYSDMDIAGKEKAVQTDEDSNRISPPSYSAGSPIIPTQYAEAPPPYESGVLGDASSSSSPYRPFPPVMKAYAEWGQVRSIFLCGEGDKEHLFCVASHTGLNAKPPLGTRPGLHLHNGPTPKSPVLGAVGNESQMAGTTYALSLESIILLPPAQRTSLTEAPVTERMHAQTNADSVSFFFSLEVGQAEKFRREKFEWIKIKKGGSHELRDGGFKLVRVTSGSPLAASGGGSGDQATSSFSVPGDSRDVVAMLEWKSMLKTLTKVFTLRLVGDGASGVLGERWVLMVVLTALRLWSLRITGRTTKSVIAAGEKVRDNETNLV